MMLNMLNMQIGEPDVLIGRHNIGVC